MRISDWSSDVCSSDLVLAAEDRPAPTPSTVAAPPPAAALPQQVSGMTGAQDLAAVGTWSTAPAYGHVWYPPVATGWVPYRDGHWARSEARRGGKTWVSKLRSRWSS